MSKLVLLDSGPVGLLTSPKLTLSPVGIVAWAENLRQNRVNIVLPGIIDYEVRRELLRANKFKGLARLDALKQQSLYIAVDDDVMNKATILWAQARQRGMPTADKRELDINTILAAHATILEDAGFGVVVVTANLRHLGQFVDARLWQDIPLEGVV